MANDWIKVRVDIPDDPTVYAISKATGDDTYATIGRLLTFWAWADRHTVDGLVDGADASLVDRLVERPGFAESLQKNGWLVIEPTGIKIPNFERHNGDSAKKRAQKSERQARYRAGKDAKVDAAPSTDATTREEKRREEKINNNPPQVLPEQTSPAITLGWQPSAELLSEIASNLGTRELDLWPHIATFAAQHDGKTIENVGSKFQKWCAKGLEFARTDAKARL